MNICPNCRRQLPDNAAVCPHCGAPLSPRAGRKKMDKHVRIVLIIAIVAVVLTAAVLASLLILKSCQTKPRTFDFTCAGYTEEINRLLGEKKLDNDKWLSNKDHSVYSDANFNIDLAIDNNSRLVKKIIVSPADKEDAVKMAAVSLMTTDKSLNQKQALDALAYYLDASLNTFVFEADENRRAKRLTPSAAPTTAPKPSESETIAETVEQEATTEPVETTTEEPTTESNKNAAYQAYLALLEANPDWFGVSNTGAAGRAENAIALKDLNGDGTEELIVTKYTADNYVPVNLAIMTYQNGEVVTLYDEWLHSFAGQGGGHLVFLGNDGRLYSAMYNYPNVNVTAYEIGGAGISSTVLAESTGHGTDNPDVKYYIEGAETTKEAFTAYFDGVCASAETCLCYYESPDLPVSGNSIAMSYSAACEYLRSNG